LQEESEILLEGFVEAIVARKLGAENSGQISGNTPL
jgi:hypothetical protein